MCLQYKCFENTAGKGEIDPKEQFSFSHSVFYLYGVLSDIFIDDSTDLNQSQTVYHKQIEIWSKLGSTLQVGNNQATGTPPYFHG